MHREVSSGKIRVKRWMKWTGHMETIGEDCLQAYCV